MNLIVPSVDNILKKTNSSAFIYCVLCNLYFFVLSRMIWVDQYQFLYMYGTNVRSRKIKWSPQREDFVRFSLIGPSRRQIRKLYRTIFCLHGIFFLQLRHEWNYVRNDVILSHNASKYWLDYKINWCTVTIQCLLSMFDNYQLICSSECLCYFRRLF